MPLSEDDKAFILTRIEQVIALRVGGFVKVKIDAAGNPVRVFTNLSEAPPGRGDGRRGARGRRNP